jgi:hypothetical protein
MKIEKTYVYGFEPAIRGARNPMNSWSLSDSESHLPIVQTQDTIIVKSSENNTECFMLGEKDLNLAQRLIKAGSEHCKFLRMIQVWADLDMTRYFWSEMDTYKFNSKNSCSTMHKLLNPKNEITLNMFEYYKEDEDIVQTVVDRLNEIREKFLSTKISEEQRVFKRRAKMLLLEGFLQLRTVNTNYAELRNIILQRRNHQLKEDWQVTFCNWVTTLPYAKELIFCGLEDEYDRLKSL